MQPILSEPTLEMLFSKKEFRQLVEKNILPALELNETKEGTKIFLVDFINEKIRSLEDSLKSIKETGDVNQYRAKLIEKALDLLVRIRQNPEVSSFLLNSFFFIS